MCICCRKEFAADVAGIADSLKGCSSTCNLAKSPGPEFELICCQAVYPILKAREA